MNSLLHTPEGVRDIYGTECARKNTVEKLILREFSRFGYERIETPSFEFFDVFNKERGSVSDRDMYKFFDRYNNTLVLRPDMTPPIARLVSRIYAGESEPIRLCYLGKSYINNPNYRGSLSELTETGAELIGDNSPEADAELIAMLISSLRAAGLEDFQIELGNAEYYRGLLEEAGIDEESGDELRELIENKNLFGVEEYVSKNLGRPEFKTVFLRLAELFGSFDNIEEAISLTSSKRAIAAIERLKKVYEILGIYGLTGYISYDLGMLNKLNYYTGIIFRAYTRGSGDYIVSGGRYDRLLLQFGKDRAAVGFAIILDRLMSAMSAQNIEIKHETQDVMIVYRKDRAADAIALASGLRAGGKRVILNLMRESLDEYKKYAASHRIKKLILIENETFEYPMEDMA